MKLITNILSILSDTYHFSFPGKKLKMRFMNMDHDYFLSTFFLLAKQKPTFLRRICFKFINKYRPLYNVIDYSKAKAAYSDQTEKHTREEYRDVSVGDWVYVEPSKYYTKKGETYESYITILDYRNSAVGRVSEVITTGDFKKYKLDSGKVVKHLGVRKATSEEISNDIDLTAIRSIN